METRARGVGNLTSKSEFSMKREIEVDNIISKLHRRHTAKLLDKLEEIKIPQIALESVKIAFSQYTNDIKQVLLASKPNEYNHNK